MNIVISLRIISGDANFEEIIDRYFEVTTKNMNIDDDFLLFTACDQVTIYLFSSKGVCHRLFFFQINLIV